MGDDFTFLNHGAFGGTLRVALESKRQWAEYIEQQPVRFIDRELFQHSVHVTRQMADVLECRPEDIFPMPNVTTAMNTIVRSWQRHFKPDASRRMLTFSVAYGSTKKLLRQVSEDTGMALD